MGWNGDPVKTCSCWWFRQETPIGVPTAGEYRGFFIGRSGHGNEVLAAGDGGNERIITKTTKGDRNIIFDFKYK